MPVTSVLYTKKLNACFPMVLKIKASWRFTYGFAVQFFYLRGGKACWVFIWGRGTSVLDGEEGHSVFMLHTSKHVRYDGLKWLYFMFQNQVNQKTPPPPAKVKRKWNICSLIYIPIQVTLSRTQTSCLFALGLLDILLEDSCILE